MAKAAALQKIDALMEDASRALTRTDYFECERLAVKALAAAHQARDYDRMARVLLPLQEARRQKRLAAADTGVVVRLNDKLPTDNELVPACYLVEPMLVGADGRDLRERLESARVPALVVVREPRTELGAWPVVMIGPVTIRAHVQPPSDDEPTVDWMLAANEALGDQAIKQVDPNDPPLTRVDDLFDRLATCPEHEKLHQRLEEACRDAVSTRVDPPRDNNTHAPPLDNERDEQTRPA